MSIRGGGSAVDLAAVTDRQHEDHHLAIVDVVDDAVVADADAHLAAAARELLAAVRSGVKRECVDGGEDASCDPTVELAQRLQC